MDADRRRWSDDFRRVKTYDETQPRFSIRGSMKYLFESYRGGHEVLDRITALCTKEDITKREKRDPGSPLNNASAHDVYYDLLDGGLRVHSGNYFFQERGAYVEGFQALRWMLHGLGYEQPRRLKGEDSVLSDEKLEELVAKELSDKGRDRG